MVTEEEAKKRWCPMDRHVNQAAKCSTNTNCGCVGSNCMLWRWVGKKVKKHEEGVPAVGYCGLAGIPEV
jgi:hypothetical protein